MQMMWFYRRRIRGHREIRGIYIGRKGLELNREKTKIMRFRKEGSRINKVN